MKVHARRCPACFDHYSTSSDRRAILVVKVGIACRMPCAVARDFFVLDLDSYMSGIRALDR